MDSLRRLILPCLLVGLITAFVLQVQPFTAAKPHRLQVSLHSDTAGRARLIWHSQRGSSPVYPADWSDVVRGEQVLSFNLPDTDRNTFKLHVIPKDAMDSFRLDPLDREGRVTIKSVALIGPHDGTVAALPPSTFSPMNKSAPFEVNGESVSLTCNSEEGIFIVPEKPIALSRITVPIRPASAALQFGAGALATLLVLALGGLVPSGARSRLAGLLAKMRDAQAEWPAATLLAASVLATAASCYPVIFFGKTFVSPNFGPTPALYNEWPSVPQSPHEVLEINRGTDTGATMWAHMPYSIVQHRAIFEHGELPLWNRYTLCGSPLIGQGVSMLGDPLHWIPIVANGAAWAWDVKFCIAKVLFSFGVGLLIFHATQRIWLAALLAISCSFLGFFAFRFNHVGYFGLCYAPWILLCWLRAARTPGRVWPWALALAAANFWELNSGTAKDAAILIIGLNFTGGLLVLTADEAWRNRVVKLALMTVGNLLFMMLSAPHWMLFLDALSQSFTYSLPALAFQIQPSLALGLFDDLFYSQIEKCEFGPMEKWMWWPMRDRFPRIKVFGDLWNIRWYFGNPRDVPREVSGLDLMETSDLATYLSPTAWPRAFFTDRLADCSSLDDFVSLLRAADGRPLAALVPEKPTGTTPASPNSLDGRTVVPASDFRLTDNSVSFTMNAPTPSIAVLINSFEKDNWRVTLDGRSVNYFRVNHAFLGVAVPEAGVHRLRFVYWPRMLTPALWTALAGVVGVALTIFAGIFSRRPISTTA